MSAVLCRPIRDDRNNLERRHKDRDSNIYPQPLVSFSAQKSSSATHNLQTSIHHPFP
jgi:hypothetical protein